MDKKIILFLIVGCQISHIISEGHHNYDFVFPDNPILSEHYKEIVPEVKEKCECVVYFSCTETVYNTDGAGKLDVRFEEDEQCPGYPYFRCCNTNKPQLTSKSKFPKKEETNKLKTSRFYSKNFGKAQSYRSKRSPQGIASWITNQAANIINQNLFGTQIGFPHGQIFQNQQSLIWPNSGFNQQTQYLMGQTETYPITNQLSYGGNYPSSYLISNVPGQNIVYNPNQIMVTPGYTSPEIISIVPEQSQGNIIETTNPQIIPAVPDQNLQTQGTNFGYNPSNQVNVNENTTPKIITNQNQGNYVENPTPVVKPVKETQDIDAVFDNITPNKENVDQSTLDEIFNAKSDDKQILANKSKQVLKDADGDECTCVVYYQCNEETSQIITDGAGLVDVRFDTESTKLCPNEEQAVCCKLSRVKK